MLDDGEIASTGAAHAPLSVRNLASAKPGFVDRLIHNAYITGGGRMATFEKASAKLYAVTLLR